MKIKNNKERQVLKMYYAINLFTVIKILIVAGLVVAYPFVIHFTDDYIQTNIYKIHDLFEPESSYLTANVCGIQCWQLNKVFITEVFAVVAIVLMIIL